MTGNRLWIFVSAMLVFAIVVLGWLLAISPMMNQTDAVRKQTQTIDTQNARHRASTSTLAASFAQLPELQARVAALQTAVPASAELDSFLDQVETFAKDAGVTIDSYAAAEAVAFGGGGVAAVPPPAASTSAGTATPPVGTAATDGGALAGKLFTIPVTIGVRGTPDQVLAFNAALQQAARQFLVTDLSFAGGGSATGTVAGSLFVLRASAAPGSAPGSTGPDPTTVASR